MLGEISLVWASDKKPTISLQVKLGFERPFLKETLLDPKLYSSTCPFFISS